MEEVEESDRTILFGGEIVYDQYGPKSFSGETWTYGGVGGKPHFGRTFILSLGDGSGIFAGNGAVR